MRCERRDGESGQRTGGQHTTARIASISLVDGWEGGKGVSVPSLIRSAEMSKTTLRLRLPELAWSGQTDSRSANTQSNNNGPDLAISCELEQQFKGTLYEISECDVKPWSKLYGIQPWLLNN